MQDILGVVMWAYLGGCKVELSGVCFQVTLYRTGQLTKALSRCPEQAFQSIIPRTLYHANTPESLVVT